MYLLCYVKLYQAHLLTCVSLLRLSGHTYLEAVQYCAATEGYEICPYEAICPMGYDAPPMGGFDTEGIPGESWVPISDDANE